MEITSDLALRPLDNKIEAKVRMLFCALQSDVLEIVLVSNIMIMANQSIYIYIYMHAPAHNQCEYTDSTKPVI